MGGEDSSNGGAVPAVRHAYIGSQERVAEVLRRPVWARETGISQWHSIFQRFERRGPPPNPQAPAEGNVIAANARPHSI